MGWELRFQVSRARARLRKGHASARLCKRHVQTRKLHQSLSRVAADTRTLARTCHSHTHRIAPHCAFPPRPARACTHATPARPCKRPPTRMRARARARTQNTHLHACTGEQGSWGLWTSRFHMRMRVSHACAATHGHACTAMHGRPCTRGCARAVAHAHVCARARAPCRTVPHCAARPRTAPHMHTHTCTHMHAYVHTCSHGHACVCACMVRAQCNASHRIM